MRNKTTLYIVRHGQSEMNIQEDKVRMAKKFWDASGSPLTELGKKQAESLAKKLASVDFDIAFSSHLTRAKQTLEILLSERDVPFETVATIYERKSGDEYWKFTREERKKLEEAVFALPEEEKFVHKITPNSESAKESVSRFTAFLNEILALHSGKKILIVNHGGIMRFFLMLIGWAKFNELPTGSIANTGYYIIETDGKDFLVREMHGINKS